MASRTGAPAGHRASLVWRPRLLGALQAGHARRLSLVSAPAGFGKTTLVSQWLSTTPFPTAWLSLDRGDNDLPRFLGYVIAALRTLSLPAPCQVTVSEPSGVDGTRERTGLIGKGLLSALQSSRPPPGELVLTTLINDLAAIPDQIVLVLDDYHLIEDQSIHDALAFFLERLPPHVHLVIATREDPPLPVARLRAQGQLSELRAGDLRFSLTEAAAFLNEMMGLDLTEEDVAALEGRTEGWISGLQLAAISMRGAKDASDFIRSFTGSHRYVLDYLMEEVLGQQPASIQTFLLQTSILDRLTGPLCDAVRLGAAESPSHAGGTALTGQQSGEAILDHLDRANLFIIPLDANRRWYRYHHLFADLLRQRLHQSTSSSAGESVTTVAELHARASAWYESNGMAIEAFRHATVANDVERAAHLIEGGGMPLTFRGALAPVMSWLESLPEAELDARPLLWVTYATVLLATGQRAGVEEKLQAAELALEATAHAGAGVEGSDQARDIVGRIAATRATVAWGLDDAESIISHSRRALEYLHPSNLPFRTSTAWKLAYAYQLQGKRAAAMQAYREAISNCEASGNTFIHIMALTGLGNLQQAGNQLHEALETYERILQLVGDPPLLAACGALLGLATILYEWNDTQAAEVQAHRAVELARQIDSNDAFASCSLFLARVRLAAGDFAGAASWLADAEHFVRQHGFTHIVPEVAAAQVRLLILQGNLEDAATLVQSQALPLSEARLHLAQGDPSAALASVEQLCRQAEASGWADRQLSGLILQALAFHAEGDAERASDTIDAALALAEPGGFVRTFVDEGTPMAGLLYEAVSRGISPDYGGRLLAAFANITPAPPDRPRARPPEHDLVEPLSERELEVLLLIAEGLTNREIGSRLYVSLNTVKAHSRNIYGKLGVHNRTQAVGRARALGVLPSA